MSKMDALRAMREARYEQRTAGARKPAAASPQAPAQRPTPVERQATPADTAAPADAELPEDRLCGHRAISGRTCTREAGHTAKSHRYA